MDVDLQLDVDLQIYSGKFYDKDQNLKQTYLLAIPGKNAVTFRINFDQRAEPCEETLKIWTGQPWYNQTVISKYHMLNPFFKQCRQCYSSV